MNTENPYAIWLYTILASLAGALTALSFRPFTSMTRVEIALALFVGASFAIFVGPWFAQWVFGTGPIDTRVMGALFYILATGSNVLIPLTVRRVSALIGVEPKP